METFEAALQDVADTAWSPLVISSGAETPCLLYLKTHFGEDGNYSLVITDLVGVWFRRSNRDMAEREKEEFNPHLDIPLHRLLATLHTHLTKPSAEITFSTESYSFYRFRWKFVCEPLPGSPAEFLRDHFTLPLLAISKELARQVERLKHIISTKDTEIREYKHRGVAISRAYQTPVFDPEAFLRSASSSEVISSAGSHKPSVFSFTEDAPGVSNAVFSKWRRTTPATQEPPTDDSEGFSGGSLGSMLPTTPSLSQGTSGLAELPNRQPSDSRSPAAICSVPNLQTTEESPTELQRRKELEERLRAQKRKKAQKQKEVVKRRKVFV